jgi:hypothetical protein
MIEELKKYFETTPREKVLENWAKSESFDEIGPTMDEFLEQIQRPQQDSSVSKCFSKDFKSTLKPKKAKLLRKKRLKNIENYTGIKVKFVVGATLWGVLQELDAQGKLKYF